MDFYTHHFGTLLNLYNKMFAAIKMFTAASAVAVKLHNSQHVVKNKTEELFFDYKSAHILFHSLSP